VVTAGELMERAMWLARAIATAPALAVEGTLRAIWMAHELGRREALSQVSLLVALGTQFDNISGGQQQFRDERPEWRLR
jgi:enoyl-CoA hydratase/carnithine racemase